MFQFKRPRNELEVFLRQGTKKSPTVPDEMFTRCPNCGTTVLSDELSENQSVCEKCGYHFPLAPRARVQLLCDEGSFHELFANLATTNPIDFPDYRKKLRLARLKSAEKEAVLCGVGEIDGQTAALFVMDGSFMMGSMGSVVGEKITRLFEYAAEHRLPVIGFTVSGGARMQEGILSLMQMAKTSGAVRQHSDQGLLYITVLTNPTTGGVTASFAMQGDIILSEPGALIGFAGPRVIEQTTKEKLPQGFQKAEFLLKKGFVDAIVPRTRLKKVLSRLLSLHTEVSGNEGD